MNIKLLKLLRKIRKSLEVMAAKYPQPYDKDLGCMCAISSWFTSRRLKELGYDVKVIDGYYKGDEKNGDSHCWMILGDKIVDLTYTQFESKAPKIYITDKDDKDFSFYREIKFVKDFLLWPGEQKPVRKNIKELEAIYAKSQNAEVEAMGRESALSLL